MSVDARYKTAFDLYPYEDLGYHKDEKQRHPVVIVGGGPVGLALALDLGMKGTPALVLDDHEGPGLGSKAICFAKRTLDIANRLGAAKPMVEKGVVWNVGKVFHADHKVFEFDLMPDQGHENPAFINLAQPYFEKFLVDQIVKVQADGAPIEIRGRNRVTGVVQHDDYSTLHIDTPDGGYELEADWVVACDGARSPMREMMGLSFKGRVFEDNFLIADVKMKAEFPTERWFWFEPTFKDAGASALLHKQPDDIWRIDFQLGAEIDRERELQPKRIRDRVDAMLSSQAGEVPDYELEWTSIYKFQCRRMEKFKVGNVFFAGDAAHQVSPFGARGANSGVQDSENLAWKLSLVLNGDAPVSLLDSYASEREFGADENILNSSRATDFMTPKTSMSRIFRDAALKLATKHEFAQKLINSGRLSVPCVYDGFAHFDDDQLNGPSVSRPGASCPDAPSDSGFLLNQLGGGFTVLTIGGEPYKPTDLAKIAITNVHIPTPSDAMARRYLGDNQSAVYLIRPDQHVVGRWQIIDQSKLEAAMLKSIGRNSS